MENQNISFSAAISSIGGYSLDVFNHNVPFNKLEHRLWELGCFVCFYISSFWFDDFFFFSFTCALGSLTNLVTGKFKYWRAFFKGAGSLSIWTIALWRKVQKEALKSWCEHVAFLSWRTSVSSLPGECEGQKRLEVFFLC